MPSRRFDWHEHIKDVEGEYRAARFAVDLVQARLEATPDLLRRNDVARAYLGDADRNLEGTYLVRLFAAFEAALRSFDRARHRDPDRTVEAAVLIDSIGGRQGQGISDAVRQGAHAVRRARNSWAHDADAAVEPLTIREARARLQTYLSWLPDEWG